MFGEIIVNRYFPNRTIHLFPNTKIKVGNQTIQTTYDLGKALNLIKMHTRSKRYCLWIDNLEMWWDASISASKNIRNLKGFMDRHSNQLFFIVATSDAYKAHILKLQEFDRVFQAEITLGSFPFNDLEKAISIRHGATHRTLVDNNLEEVKSNQLRKMANKVSRSGNGNIGEALNKWALSIQLVHEENVKFNYKQGSPMPDFINPDGINLLLFGLCLSFHKHVNGFLDACKEAIVGSVGILIQFPLYFGIMGIMQESGLATLIAQSIILQMPEWEHPVITISSLL